MIYFKKNNRGLIRTVILVIFLILVLSYLGINIRSIISSDTFRDNWSYVSDLAVRIWKNYLSGPLSYLWNKILVPYVWQPILENLTGKE